MMKESLRVLGLVTLVVAAAAPAFASAVPEIDPTTAVSGVTALVGGLLVLMGRRRRK